MREAGVSIQCFLIVEDKFSLLPVERGRGESKRDFILILGDTQYPHEPFKPDFKDTSHESSYWREYWSLFSNVPAGLALKSDESLDLDAKTWYNDNAIYKINFTRYPHHSYVGGSWISQRTPITQLDGYGCAVLYIRSFITAQPHFY